MRHVGRNYWVIKKHILIQKHEGCVCFYPHKHSNTLKPCTSMSSCRFDPDGAQSWCSRSTYIHKHVEVSWFHVILSLLYLTLFLQMTLDYLMCSITTPLMFSLCFMHTCCMKVKRLSGFLVQWCHCCQN